MTLYLNEKRLQPATLSEVEGFVQRSFRAFSERGAGAWRYKESQDHPHKHASTQAQNDYDGFECSFNKAADHDDDELVGWCWWYLSLFV
jgi:hypothetical protein